jgi:hypothetical protein
LRAWKRSYDPIVRRSYPSCLVLLLALAGAARSEPGPDVRALLERGDAAWEHRADGHLGDGRAVPGPILEAIRAYEEAVASGPSSAEARWKLARAMHFAAEFASASVDEERARLARATEVTSTAGDVAGADSRELAALRFWEAIAWASWSQRHGLLAAVREGVASRIHQAALAAIALDPTVEEGGAHRLVARLHATLPRLPLLSGWVDREQALPEIERALAISATHLGNRTLHGLTLLDVAPERRGEALRILEDAASATPRPEQVVEEIAVRALARERLAEERASASR